MTKQATVRFWRTFLLCGVRSLHENRVVGPDGMLQNGNFFVYILFTHQQMQFLLNFEKFKFTWKYT